MFRTAAAFVLVGVVFAVNAEGKGRLIETPSSTSVVSSETIDILPVVRDATSIIYLTPEYGGTQTVEDFNVSGVVGSPDGTWVWGEGNGSVMRISLNGEKTRLPLARADEMIASATIRLVEEVVPRSELAALDAVNGVITFLDAQSRREVTTFPSPYVEISGIAWNPFDRHYMAAQTTLGRMLKIDPFQGFTAVVPMPQGLLPIGVEASGEGFEVTTANGRLAFCRDFMCTLRNPLPNGGMAAGIGCVNGKCYTGDINGGRYFSWNTMDPPLQTQYQEFSIRPDRFVIRIGSTKKQVYLQLTDEEGHSDSFLIPDVIHRRTIRY